MKAFRRVLAQLKQPAQENVESTSVQTRDYIYDPLPEGNFVRLVRLKPGTGDSQLQCHLFTVSLTRCLKYEALSYVWGDSYTRVPLICSGGQIEITKNLHSALRQLRDRNKERTLWIDAICINQKDLAERNQQVLRMGDIYAKARVVLVWLGPDAENDREAFQFLEWLQSFWDRPKFGDTLHDDLQKLREFSRALAAYEDEDRTKTRHVMHLLLRPWFGRVWIIQEVAKARRVLMICGHQSLTYEIFLSGAYVFRTLSIAALVTVDFASVHGPVYGNIVTLDACRTAIKDDDFHLLEHLPTARFFKSSDPRDKIYALLGMMKHPELVRSRPNYEKDPREVFKDFAIDALIHDRQMAMLSCCYQLGASEISRDLPSWVPDWTLPTDCVPFFAMKMRFRAATTTKVDLSLSSDSKVLIVKGKLLCSISQISTCLSSEMQTHTVLGEDLGDPSSTERMHARCKWLLAWLQECHQLALGKDCILPEAHESSKHDHLLQALLCDMDRGGSQLKQLRNMCRNMDKTMRTLEILQSSDLNSREEEEYRAQAVDLLNKIESLFQLGLVMTVKRKFCRTNSGHLGLVVPCAEINDLVCVFYGAQVLHVLRPDGGGHHRLVGECYLRGLMYGKSLEMHDIEPQYFHIR